MLRTTSEGISDATSEATEAGSEDAKLESLITSPESRGERAAW